MGISPLIFSGLVFIQQWGSLRHASNVAFACLFANQKGLLANDVSAYAKRQIDYILGMKIHIGQSVQLKISMPSARAI